MKRKDKKAGLENTRYPTSEEKVTGNGVDGTHTTTGAWAVEAVDAPKSFSYNTLRFLAVDAGNRDLKYATSIHVPKVTTKPATNITNTSARLNATVNAKQWQTLAWFE